MTRVVLAVGTRKGAFFLESTPDRAVWTVRGPRLKGWEVSDLMLDDRGYNGGGATGDGAAGDGALGGGAAGDNGPRGNGADIGGANGGEADDADGADSAGGRHPPLFAAVGHYVYGPAIHRSTDLGESWAQVEASPRYDDRELNQIWCVEPGRPDEPDVLYAGVDEAGLFVSRDGGGRWEEVPGLAEHGTRPRWTPGKGGLCCHSVLPDPEDPERAWVGISAVGVFRTTDGGATWTLCNDGLEVTVPDDDHARLGSCVHSLVLDPTDPDRLFQQNHAGVYRSTDGADSWERVDGDLPSSFGFPIAMHPRDPDTLYTVPLESDEYRMAIDGRPAVWRTTDAGDSWERCADGLPDDSWVTVLRQAMATDPLDPAGVYVGTTGGRVFYSADAGDSWKVVDCNLPRINSLRAVVVE